MSEERESDLELEDITSEDDDQSSDSAGYKINIYGYDMNVEMLIKKLKEGEIIIPPFQRKFVWDKKKASKLIESFLLGLPVPQIFLFREAKKQDLLVVDGQQRLKSILYFFEGVFHDETIFKLKDVKDLWKGRTYAELTEYDKRKFKNSLLRTTIFEQIVPDDDSSIYEIFERLNTGGVSLNPQEVRNCLIRGNINKFLEQINTYPNWRLLLGREEPDSRMKDVEMILRFFALVKNLGTYEKPLKKFISDFMKQNKQLSEQTQKEWTNLFQRVIDKILKDLGSDAFRLKRGISVTIFDSVTVALGTLEPENVTNLKAKYEQLIKNPSYLDAVSKSTTDKDRVELRIKTAIEFFSK